LENASASVVGTIYFSCAIDVTVFRDAQWFCFWSRIHFMWSGALTAFFSMVFETNSPFYLLLLENLNTILQSETRPSQNPSLLLPVT
jgi:hypothetical protein